MIRTIRFRNFKALRDFSLTLHEINVLVGPNNAGKSTALDALRGLSAALKVGRTRLPRPVIGVAGVRARGYEIPTASLPIGLANIHSDYVEDDTTLEFGLSNGNKLRLVFKPSGGCVLCLEETTHHTETTADFRRNYPVEVAIVPTLGPFEEEENLLNEDYVKRTELTRRSHRIFRNIWRRRPDAEFEEFRALVESTWPGMSIKAPEVLDYQEKRLGMFCREHRIDREVAWAGFGFQVWLQFLTHLIGARPATTLVVDEPDIYLHPDLQRRLFSLLRKHGGQVVLATHSVEIINEADHDEVVVIDKTRRSARRIGDIDGLQGVIETLGSNQNIHLARLSRGRRVLFFEGQDFKLVKRFAERLSLEGLATDVDTTVIDIGGFSQFRRIEDAAWTFRRILQADIHIASLLDRDYRCDDEITELLRRLRDISANCYVLEGKEIENYLFHIPALVAAARERLRARRNPLADDVRRLENYIRIQLDKLTEAMKPHVIGQVSAHWSSYYRPTGKDPATLVSESIQLLDSRWCDLEERLMLVPGKELLSNLNRVLQQEHNVTLTPALIIRHLAPSAIRSDLREILRSLDDFVRAK